MAPYRARHRDVRWTRPPSWHLTLLFLGSVDRSRVPVLEALVDAVASAHQPYRAVAALGDGRHRQGDGVAWLGLDEGAGRLIEIADDVATACPPGITAGARPKRTPSAHLTLVRKADDAVIEALREEACGPLRVAWDIDRICLVRSHLEKAGARYVTLHQATL